MKTSPDAILDRTLSPTDTDKARFFTTEGADAAKTRAWLRGEADPTRASTFPLIRAPAPAAFRRSRFGRLLSQGGSPRGGAQSRKTGEPTPGLVRVIALSTLDLTTAGLPLEAEISFPDRLTLFWCRSARLLATP